MTGPRRVLLALLGAALLPPSSTAMPYVGGYYPGSMPWGYGRGMSTGYALQGLASVTQAQGEYWNQIESARMSRENVRQTQIDTRRKQVEWELEYEKLRP